MPLNEITVLEIFTYPKDLRFSIKQHKGSPRFYIAISRGPAGGFQTLAVSNELDTTDKVITEIKEDLTLICTMLTSPFEAWQVQLANKPDEQYPKEDKPEALTMGLIDWITAQLKEKQLAQTWEFSTG